MTQRICGYDLNGWSDRAARNWLLDADGEEKGEAATGEAVKGAVVVRTGEGKSAAWVGGAQASLAPHGRGGGWGQETGDRSRRRSVRDVLADDHSPLEQLVAALSGLASGARYVAVVVDDHPGSTETFQDRLRQALHKGRLGRGILVWRPVLTVLGSISGAGDRALRAGLQVGVINHVADGFTVQQLRLREGSPDPSRLAPERRTTARLVQSALGYGGLFANARRAYAAARDDLWGEWTEVSRMVFEHALGETPRPEIQRDDRGNYTRVDPLPALATPDADLPADLAQSLAGCDVILFETLTAGALKADLVERIAQATGRAPTAVHEASVAEGALEAARRYAAGEAVYYDFLPQISTIVWGKDGPGGHDLIEADAALPAGKVYRSPRPVRFEIGRGANKCDVYLRKEGDPAPRKATIALDERLKEALDVELHLEQMPLAGRARLFIDAPRLGRRFEIDWDKAQPDARTWEEIIADLQTPPPTIPDRMVLPCGINCWERRNGLGEALATNDGRSEVNWKQLADAMARSVKGVYCISSDGVLPSKVSPIMEEQLERLSNRAMQLLRERIRGAVVGDNEALRFLTWQFRRAPVELERMLLEAWASEDAPLLQHPFIRRHTSWTLVYQGFGRICRTPEGEEEGLRRLLAKPVRDWRSDRETAATAFLLARSDTAPLRLSRRDVELLAQRVLIEFEAFRGGIYANFRYAPMLLGGLLRWRLKEPRSLVAGQDDLATQMERAVNAALRHLGRAPSHDRSRWTQAKSRYESLLQSLKLELQGAGETPDILRRSFSAGEDD